MRTVCSSETLQVPPCENQHPATSKSFQQITCSLKQNLKLAFWALSLNRFFSQCLCMKGLQVWNTFRENGTLLRTPVPQVPCTGVQGQSDLCSHCCCPWVCLFAISLTHTQMGF